MRTYESDFGNEMNKLASTLCPLRAGTSKANWDSLHGTPPVQPKRIGTSVRRLPVRYMRHGLSRHAVCLSLRTAAGSNPRSWFHQRREYGGALLVLRVPPGALYFPVAG